MTSEKNEHGENSTEDSPTEDVQTEPPPTRPESPVRVLFSRFSRRFRPRTQFSFASEPASDSDEPFQPEPVIQAGEVVQAGNDRTKDDKTWELTNQMPQAVEISSTGTEPPKRIPPFGRVTLTSSELGHYPMEEWISRGVLEKTEAVEPEFPPEQILLMIWGAGLFYSGFVWVIAWGIGKLIDWSPPDSWWLWTVSLATVASIGSLSWHFARRGALRTTVRKMRHSIGGVLQLAIAFGIPAVTVFAGQYAVPQEVVADADSGHTIEGDYWGHARPD